VSIKNDAFQAFKRPKPSDSKKAMKSISSKIVFGQETSEN